MSDLEDRAWLSRSRIVDNLNDNRVNDKVLQETQGSLRSTEKLIRDQKYIGLYGTVAGGVLALIGLGISLRPSSKHNNLA